MFLNTYVYPYHLHRLLPKDICQYIADLTNNVPILTCHLCNEIVLSEYVTKLACENLDLVWTEDKNWLITPNGNGLSTQSGNKKSGNKLSKQNQRIEKLEYILQNVQNVQKKTCQGFQKMSSTPDILLNEDGIAYENVSRQLVQHCFYKLIGSNVTCYVCIMDMFRMRRSLKFWKKTLNLTLI